MLIKPAVFQQVQTPVQDRDQPEVSVQPGYRCLQEGDRDPPLLPPAYQGKGRREAEHLHQPALKAHIVPQQRGRPGTATLPEEEGRAVSMAH